MDQLQAKLDELRASSENTELLELCLLISKGMLSGDNGFTFSEMGCDWTCDYCCEDSREYKDIVHEDDCRYLKLARFAGRDDVKSMSDEEE